MRRILTIAFVLGFVAPASAQVNNPGVNGPASATSGHIATYSGTSGKIIQDGGAVPTSSPCASFGTTTGTCLQGAGPLGTPSSGTAINLVGLPISTGVSGLGANVATALSNAVNTSGGLVTSANGTLSGTTTAAAIIGLSLDAHTTDASLSFLTANGVWLTGTSSTALRLSGDGANRQQTITLLGGTNGTISFNTSNNQVLMLNANGTFTFNTTNYASCSAFVTNASAVFSGTCTSAIRFKDPIGPLPDLSEMAMHVRTDIWKYKPQYQHVQSFDDKIHVSLIADDIARMEPKCAMYGDDGLVRNYEDRCVTAVLWSLWKRDHSRIVELEEGHTRSGCKHLWINGMVCW